MFKFVKSLDGYAGVALVYLDTRTDDYIMVSRAITFDRGDETMIFPYDMERGEVIDWSELYAGYRETHTEALVNYAAGE